MSRADGDRPAEGSVPVVRGRKVEDLPAAEVVGRMAGAVRVVADVGAGDGRTAYRLARAHPDWLVVGIDPASDRMAATSTRAGRRSEKGGAPNLLLVRASIEALPPALAGVAHEVGVLMPWGRLLEGVVRGEPDVCGGLRALARDGATLDVTIGTSIWREPVPVALRDLPELTPDRARAELSPRLATAGWALDEARLVGGDELEASASSWARRLDARGDERVLHLRAHATPRPG